MPSGVLFVHNNFPGQFGDLAETLMARGVEFVSPPQSQPWGTFAIFKDVDGNQFVLSSR